MEIRWNKNAISRGSPDTDAILRPSFRDKLDPIGANGAQCLDSNRTNVTDRGKSAYLRFLASAADSAAAPATYTVLFRCESASESDTVAAQARQRPSDHGIMVNPSGRRSSELVNPLGSKTAGNASAAERPGEWCRWLHCGEPAFQPSTDMRAVNSTVAYNGAKWTAMRRSEHTSNAQSDSHSDWLVVQSEATRSDWQRHEPVTCMRCWYSQQSGPVDWGVLAISPIPYSPNPYSPIPYSPIPYSPIPYLPKPCSSFATNQTPNN